MLSKEFKQSSSLLGVLFIFISLGDFFYKKNILDVNMASRFVVFLTLTSVFMFYFIRFLHAPKNIYKHENIIKYKMITYFCLYFFIVAYSAVANFLGASFQDYTVDAIIISPVVLSFLFFYTKKIDSRKEDPKDEYYNFGVNLSNKKIIIDKFLLVFLLKAQFIPFMYLIELSAIERFFYMDLSLSWADFYTSMFYGGILIDVSLAFLGYIFCSEVFGNKITSIESNKLGWFFCLICYPPFSWITIHVYSDFERFSVIPSDSNFILFFKFLTILQFFCWIVYWWSTMEFGLKFSNLTWRGLVSSGPYRYFKHPAYLFKNIYWWLILIPVLFSTDFLESIHLMMGLIFISFIYYGRAKSEEKHLLQFKEYSDYFYRK